jgi:GNAT superfamily N-acetyltransferase
MANISGVISPVLRRPTTLYISDTPEPGTVPRGFVHQTIKQLEARYRTESFLFDSDSYSTNLYLSSHGLQFGNGHLDLSVHAIASAFGIEFSEERATRVLTVYNGGAHWVLDGALLRKPIPALSWIPTLMRLSDHMQGLRFGFYDGAITYVKPANMMTNPMLVGYKVGRYLDLGVVRKPSQAVGPIRCRTGILSPGTVHKLSTLECAETRIDYPKDLVWNFEDDWSENRHVLFTWQDIWRHPIAYSVIDPTDGELDCVRVVPSARGLGYGKLVVEHAAVHGARVLRCETHLRSWYESLGWKVTGRGKTRITMRKDK